MRQNFDSDIWGPHAWFFLETVCMGYPTDPSYEEKKQAENFFKALQFMIPCEKCRNHYKKHLKKYPLNGEILSSRDNLFMWIVDIHNSVHKNKQKTYDDTFNYYMDMYKINVNDEDKNTNSSVTLKGFLFYFIMIMFISFIIYQICITS